MLFKVSLAGCGNQEGPGQTEVVGNLTLFPLRNTQSLAWALLQDPALRGGGPEGPRNRVWIWSGSQQGSAPQQPWEPGCRIEGVAQSWHAKVCQKTLLKKND